MTYVKYECEHIILSEFFTEAVLAESADDGCHQDCYPLSALLFSM